VCILRYQLSLNDWHIKRGRVYRYGLAILLFAVALSARLLILPVEVGYAFITFYPLIVVAFYLCNRGPGLLVIILCAVFSYYMFTPPFWVFSHNLGSLTPLFIFLFSSSLIGIVVSKMHYYHNALSLSEQRYGGMLEDQTETICRFKADGEILYVNDAFCRFFSKTADALIGTSWQPIVIEEDLEQVHAKLNTLSSLNPVVNIENRVVTANGEIRWGQFINRALKFLDIRALCFDDLIQSIV
jgi:PAS domain S-box-containing protein